MLYIIYLYSYIILQNLGVISHNHNNNNNYISVEISYLGGQQLKHQRDSLKFKILNSSDSTPTTASTRYGLDEDYVTFTVTCTIRNDDKIFLFLP